MKTAREKAGLTQRQLAAKTGMRQSQIAKIELGDQAVRVMELIEWGRATGADPRDILSLAL